MQKAQETLGKITGGAFGTKLPTAKLGKNGPEVTRMGFGLMGLVRVSRARCRRNGADCNKSAFYGRPKPDEERFKVLDKCYELGELFCEHDRIDFDPFAFLIALQGTLPTCTMTQKIF